MKQDVYEATLSEYIARPYPAIDCIPDALEFCPPRYWETKKSEAVVLRALSKDYISLESVARETVPNYERPLGTPLFKYYFSRYDF